MLSSGSGSDTEGSGSGSERGSERCSERSGGGSGSESGGSEDSDPRLRKRARRRGLGGDDSDGDGSGDDDDDDDDDDDIDPVTIVTDQGDINQSLADRPCLLCNEDDPDEDPVYVLAWRNLASSNCNAIKACGDIDTALAMLRTIKSRLVFSDMREASDLPLQVAALQHACDIFGIEINSSVPVGLTIKLHELILFRLHRLVMAIMRGLHSDGLVLEHSETGQLLASNYEVAREKLEHEVRDLYITIVKTMYVAAQFVMHANQMLGCMMEEHTISVATPPTAWILLSEHPDAADMPKELRAQMRLLELLYHEGKRRMGDNVMEEVLVMHGDKTFKTYAWKVESSVKNYVERQTAMSKNMSLFIDRGPRPTRQLVENLTNCITHMFPALIVQQGIYSCRDCVMDFISEKMRFYFFNAECPKVQLLQRQIEASLELHEEAIQDLDDLTTNYTGLLALLRNVTGQMSVLQTVFTKQRVLEYGIRGLSASGGTDSAALLERGRLDAAQTQRKADRLTAKLQRSREGVLRKLRAYAADAVGAGDEADATIALVVEQLGAGDEAGGGEAPWWRAAEVAIRAIEVLLDYTAACRDATRASADFLASMVVVGPPPTGTTAELYRDQRFPFEAFEPFCSPRERGPVAHDGMVAGMGDVELEPWCRTCKASALVVDWHDMETAPWEKVFADQNLPPDAVDIFAYVLTGRMIFPPGVYDECQIAKMVVGVAGAGKGVQQAVESSLHSSQDDESSHTGIIMSNIENPFGPSQVLGTKPETKAFACICPDVTKELRNCFPMGVLLIWISNELGRWPVKKETPLWDKAPHTSFYSNSAMPHKDKGGNLIRRLVIMMCTKVIKNTDTTLLKRIMNNWVLLLIKLAFAYRSWADRVRGQGPWNAGVLPQYCHDSQDVLRSLKWPIMAFLRSADGNTIVLDTTANAELGSGEPPIQGFMSMRKLQSLVNQYVQSNKCFSAVDWSDTTMVEQSLDRCGCQIVIPSRTDPDTLPPTMNPRARGKWIVGVAERSDDVAAPVEPAVPSAPSAFVVGGASL